MWTKHDENVVEPVPIIPPVANVEIAISRGRFVFEKEKLRLVAGMAPSAPIR